MSTSVINSNDSYNAPNLFDVNDEPDPGHRTKGELGVIDKNTAIQTQRLIFKRKCPEHNECPICFVDMFSKVVGYTPCGHAMCRDCIVNQIQKSCPFSSYKYNCPMCRNNMDQFMIGIERYNRREEIIKSEL